MFAQKKFNLDVINSSHESMMHVLRISSIIDLKNKHD